MLVYDEHLELSCPTAQPHFAIMTTLDGFGDNRKCLRVLCVCYFVLFVCLHWALLPTREIWPFR